MKKFIIIVCLFALVAFCGYLLKKTPKEKVLVENEEEIVVSEQKLPETLFSFKKDELSNKCQSDNAQLCAIEKAIKCTIDPTFDGCKEAKIPQFIFITDSGTDRPSEISYKFVEKKSLNNQTVEYYTDSTCNGTWFGLCHGRVIYVLSPDGNDWAVKDIYAIEQ